jgi:uncharacterized protein HemX
MGHVSRAIAYLFLTASAAMATTGTPTTRSSPATGAVPDRGDGGLIQYWWVVLVVLLAAAAFWYFTRRNSRTA